MAVSFMDGQLVVTPVGAFIAAMIASFLPGTSATKSRPGPAWPAEYG